MVWCCEHNTCQEKQKNTIAKKVNITKHEGEWKLSQTLILVIQIPGWCELESQGKERGNHSLNQNNNSDVLNAGEI